ncbi:hypothetical protein E1281_36055, partial [Actinomadura sp. KC345]
MNDGQRGATGPGTGAAGEAPEANPWIIIDDTEEDAAAWPSQAAEEAPAAPPQAGQAGPSAGPGPGQPPPEARNGAQGAGWDSLGTWDSWNGMPASPPGS